MREIEGLQKLFWSDVPHLDARSIERLEWIETDFAAAYAEHALEFNTDHIIDAQLSMVKEDGWLWLQHDFYEPDLDEPILSEAAIEVVWYIDRFGAERAKLICPICALTTRRLALYPGGSCCGRCAKINTAEPVIGELKSAIRSAKQVSEQLKSPTWRLPPQERPYRMRRTTYRKLKQRRAVILSEINSMTCGEMISGTA